jgi:hypothetical protein
VQLWHCELAPGELLPEMPSHLTLIGMDTMHASEQP